MAEVSEFEVARRIRSLVLQHAGESMVYKSWGHTLAANNMTELPERINTTVDVSGFTKEQFDQLGFGTWDEDTPVRLIPLWLFPFIADGVEYTTIGGDKITKREQMDNDHRFGCLAFGILPANPT